MRKKIYCCIEKLNQPGNQKYVKHFRNITAKIALTLEGKVGYGKIEKIDVVYYRKQFCLYLGGGLLFNNKGCKIDM